MNRILQASYQMQSKWRFSTATPILLLLIGVAGPVSAQDEPSRVQAGAGLVVGVPSGEFGNYVTNPGGGITGHLGYRIPNTLAIIGVNVGYIIYGRETRREPFSLTAPDVKVRVITENNILPVNLFLRFQPREGRLRPYVEGLTGFHYLFTETTIEDIPTSTENGFIASSTNFGDFSFTYGGSVGVMLQVFDGNEKRRTQGGAVKSVSLDFRFRYLNGGNTSYLERGAITRSAGQVTLNTTRSRTNIATIYIGGAVEF